MIARSWDGLTKAEQADAYADYIRRTGFADLAATSGNRGVYVLRRREGDEARFRVLSLWDGVDAIRRFAGDDPERARYYPEDEGFLKRLEPNVEHFDVVAQSGPGAARERGRRAGAGARVAGPGRHLARAGAPRTARGRVSRGGGGASHRRGPHHLGAGAPRDRVDRRVPASAGGRGDRGARSRGLPRATASPRRAPGRRPRRRCSRRTRRSRRASLASQPRSSAAPVPGRPFDKHFQVRAAIRHTVYHSGQIGLLRKG